MPPGAIPTLLRCPARDSSSLGHRDLTTPALRPTSSHPRRSARQLPLRKAALPQTRSLFPSPPHPCPPTAASPATLLLEGRLRQEPALARAWVAQNEPLLVPLPRGGDTPLPGRCLSPRQGNGFGGFGQDSCRATAAHHQPLGKDRGDRPQATCGPHLSQAGDGLRGSPCSPLQLWVLSLGREVGARALLAAQEPDLCSRSQNPAPQPLLHAPAGQTERLRRAPSPAESHRLVKAPRPGSTRAAARGLAAGRDRQCSRGHREEGGCASLPGPWLGRSRCAPGRGNGEQRADHQAKQGHACWLLLWGQHSVGTARGQRKRT